MAIQFISSVGYNGTNGDVPAGYQIGDLIVVIAFRDDGSEPGIGAGVGFVDARAPGGFGNFRWRIGFKYAEANSGLVTGTWNGACRISVHVYRNAAINGVNLASTGSGDGNVIYDPLTAGHSGSWMLAWVGTANNDNTNLASSPPTGFTLRTNATGSGSNRRIVSFDSDGPLTSFAGSNRGKGGTNGAWRAFVVELTENIPGTMSWSELSSADTVSANLYKDLTATGSFRPASMNLSAKLLKAAEGTAAWTESDDTVTTVTQKGRIGGLAWTESNDTTSANLYKDLTVTGSFRPANMTLDATMDVAINGSMAWSESNDSVTSMLTQNRTGSLAWAEGDDALDANLLAERFGQMAWAEGPDELTTSAMLEAQGSMAWTEEDDYIITGFNPDETNRRPDECRDIDEMVEEEIDKVLTQYRESPNLLFVIRSGLLAAAEAWDFLCDVPEYFDLETAVGDQLTIIGKRMGFPRCHCICAPPSVFGFSCGLNDGNPLIKYVGFCETGVWEDCAQTGITEVCIDDDEIYRRFLFVRAYQVLKRYDYESLKACLKIMWGDKAKVIDYGDGRVVLAPFRVLTETEKRLIKLIPRVMPVALGIRVLIHFGTYPLIAGFGDGWSGFCEEIPGEVIYTDTEGDRYMITENGIEYLEPDEYTRDAYWLCPIDVKPYSC